MGGFSFLTFHCPGKIPMSLLFSPVKKAAPSIAPFKGRTSISGLKEIIGNTKWAEVGFSVCSWAISGGSSCNRTQDYDIIPWEELLLLASTTFNHSETSWLLTLWQSPIGGVSSGWLTFNISLMLRIINNSLVQVNHY